MKVEFDLSALRRTEWSGHLTRFVLGGAVTAIAGLIAKVFGPSVGGLFLAFPAIFPASAMLLDKHEREKKRSAGIPKTVRGQQAVGLDARGAALGSVALGAFALLIWKTLPGHSAGAALSGALLVWALLAGAFWRVRQLHVFLSRRT